METITNSTRPHSALRATYIDQCGIETNAYQIALKDILHDHSRKQRLYMPIVAINTVTTQLIAPPN